MLCTSQASVQDQATLHAAASSDAPSSAVACRGCSSEDAAALVEPLAPLEAVAALLPLPLPLPLPLLVPRGEAEEEEEAVLLSELQ